ncbi:MAG: GTPase Era [Candidatus Makana argininalis]
MNYCGYVPIIGRPNVGKSTLLNYLIGNKISITSKKKQTTTNLIYGIYTNLIYQVIYVDNPGFIIKEKKKYFFNKNEYKNMIHKTDTIIFVVEVFKWNIIEDILLNKINNRDYNIIIAINKIDKINNKKLLLPFIKFINLKNKFCKIIPISAKNGININILSNLICQSIKKRNHIFPKNYITNQSKTFFISEIIREKIIRLIGNEIPYLISVYIEKINKITNGVYIIYSVILVNNINHKKIIIGNNGSKIKLIGILSKKEIEYLFKINIFLKLWVKIKTQNLK